MKTPKHIARQFDLIPAPFNLVGETLPVADKIPPRVDDEPEWNRGSLFPDFVPFKEDYLRYK